MHTIDTQTKVLISPAERSIDENLESDIYIEKRKQYTLHDIWGGLHDMNTLIYSLQSEGLIPTK